MNSARVFLNTSSNFAAVTNRTAFSAPAFGASGESPRDFIGIVEAKALHFVREKFLGKGSLPRAVAAGDDVDCRSCSGH